MPLLMLLLMQMLLSTLTLTSTSMLMNVNASVDARVTVTPLDTGLTKIYGHQMYSAAQDLHPGSTVVLFGTLSDV